MTNRTDNLIDDPTILEAQLEEISQLWEVFTTRAEQQSEEIHEASIVAQRQASLYTNLFNWIEPVGVKLRVTNHSDNLIIGIYRLITSC